MIDSISPAVTLTVAWRPEASVTVMPVPVCANRRPTWRGLRTETSRPCASKVNTRLLRVVSVQPSAVRRSVDRTPGGRTKPSPLALNSVSEPSSARTNTPSAVAVTFMSKTQAQPGPNAEAPVFSDE